jgi:A/G-specific adenine glycosylase
MTPHHTLTEAGVRDFRLRLQRWFSREQRTLPWRGGSDPYRILVSEIMLQQTRVAVVEERYKKFLGQFPAVAQLARAREQTVLAAWSGLGYYRRARALHAAARMIHCAGAFPSSSASLRELPGVGRYTAAAVASIAFGERVAVVDGNVQRVLRRFFGRNLSDEQCWQAANRLLDAKHSGDFNQAMMELGALICLPARPLCERCPVARRCAWRGAETTHKQPARRKAVLNYLLARRNGSVLLKQRAPESTLMPLMWDLPAFTAKPDREPALQVRHSITTTDYNVFVFAGQGRKQNGARWVPLNSASKMPLTGLARKILMRLELLSPR